MEARELSNTDTVTRRLPPWLRQTIRNSEEVLRIKKILRQKHLNTVCQSAGCPNITHCYQKPTATFMILGNICTRHCQYCGVMKGVPESVDPNEPDHIAETAQLLELKHVVITSVTRDDLEDGGAAQFAATVKKIHRKLPKSTVEVLIPDFKGSLDSLKIVIESGVDILNHNVETVPRMYAEIRPEADFDRSINLLRKSKELYPDVITKSGLMVGLGEEQKEVIDVFRTLYSNHCDALTVGQYLAPSYNSYPVKAYIEPRQFNKYRTDAENIGFRWISSAPLVRSSFNAEDFFRKPGSASS